MKSFMKSAEDAESETHKYKLTAQVIYPAPDAEVPELSEEDPDLLICAATKQRNSNVHQLRDRLQLRP